MVCEQKWDIVTTLPFLATTFLVPLGIIVFLNYRVLKVVSRLQSSFKIIPITIEEQPGSGHPEQNVQNQSEKQGKLKRERNIHFPDLLTRNEKGETVKQPRKRHVIKRGTLKKGSVNAEERQNPAFQEEPEEIKEVTHQTVLAQKNEGSPEVRCSGPVQWRSKCSKRTMKEIEILKEGFNSALQPTNSSSNDQHSWFEVHIVKHLSPQQTASQEKQPHEDDSVDCKTNPLQERETKKTQKMLKGSSKSRVYQENTGGLFIFQGTTLENKRGSHHILYS